MVPDWEAYAYRLRMYLILGCMKIIPVVYTTRATPQNHMRAQRPCCCFGHCSGKGGLNERPTMILVAWQPSAHVRVGDDLDTVSARVLSVRQSTARWAVTSRAVFELLQPFIVLSRWNDCPV